jgi:TP901 family phage tail tape measure protein
MAKKISSKDLFDKEDLFKGVRDSADRTIKKLTELKNGMIRSAKEIKTAFNGIKLDNLKDLEKFVQLAEKSSKITQQSIQIDKQKKVAIDQKKQAEIGLLKVEQEKEKLKQQQMRTQNMVNSQQEKANKQKERQKKLLENEANAYKKLEKNTRLLKNESKRLGAEMLALEQSGKKNTAEYRKLASQYKQVTRAAQQGDAQLKKLDKTVGDNFRNVGNYRSALAGLNRTLGALGLAFGAGQLLRTGVGAIVEFDQAVADLGAITGASGQDLKFYKEQANELGVSVQGGAAAVVEAYKLIGSAKPDLLENKEALNEVTKAAITLSQASGLELPDAATRLTAAMNQFKAPAQEATRYIDALANGAKFGSAEIPQITEALVKFGAVANSTGVSVEESTAAIELLAEREIKGAEAGTKLRNVMLKLSAPDALPKKAIQVFDDLGVSMEKLTDPSLSFQDRLELLKPLLKDNANLVKVFGIENEVAAQILLESTERLGELNEKMHEQGTAQEQAEKRTNTLGQALLELKNAFLSLFTSVGDGEGSMQGFIDSIKWVAKNLPQIVSVIFKLVRAFVIYKAALLAIKGVQWIVNGGFQELGKAIASQIPMTKAYRLEQLKLSRAMKASGTATKGAATSVKSFGKALSSIALVGIISLIYDMATPWYEVASGLAESRRQKAMYDQAVKKGQELSDKFIEKEKKTLDEKMRLLDLEIRKRKVAGEDEKKLAKERAKREAEIIQNAKNRVAQQQEDLKFAVRERKEQLKTFKQLEERAKRLPIGPGGQIGAPQPVMKKALDDFKAALRDAAFEEGARTKVSMEVTEFFDYAKSRKEFIQNELTKEKEQLKGINGSIGEFNALLDEAYISLDETNYEINKGNQYVVNRKKHASQITTQFKKQNEYLSRQKELLFEIRQAERERIIEITENAIEKEFDKQVENITKTNNFDSKALNNLIKRKARLEKAAIRAKAKFDKEALDEKYEREAQARKDALKEEYLNLIKNADGNATAIAKINQNYANEQQKLDAQERLRQTDLTSEKELINKQAANEILRVNEDMYSDLESMDDKLLKELEKNNERLAQEEQDAIQDELERRQTAEEQKREFIRLTTEYAIKQSQKVVDQIEKEIEAAEKQADTLRELAKQGNINAEDSLAEQERIIAEANKRREKELRRQQRLKLAQSVYETFSKNLESLQPGEKTSKALADTIRDTTLLQAFINSLPGFEKGTEDTGKDGRGVDGKGGMLSVLHPNERVVPKSLNDQLNGMSNEELTRIATEYQNGTLINRTKGSDSLDFAIVVNELQDLKKVIKEKPETNIEVGQITQSAMEIVKRSKKGNSVIYNRYKVK